MSSHFLKRQLPAAEDEPLAAVLQCFSDLLLIHPFWKRRLERCFHGNQLRHVSANCNVGQQIAVIHEDSNLGVRKCIEISADGTNSVCSQLFAVSSPCV